MPRSSDELDAEADNRAEESENLHDAADKTREAEDAQDSAK
jgi:hypothetical protein